MKDSKSEISNRNLPATPKSMTDTQLQPSDASAFPAAIKLENENAMDDSEPMGEEEKTEYEYSEEYDDSASADDEQRFVLAPTPAQLGQAPLQRRLGSLVGGDANSKFS